MSLDWDKIKANFPIWKTVRLEIHSYCNRNCEFCPRYDDRTGVRKDEHGKHVRIKMPTEKVHALLDEISSFGWRGHIGFHRLSEPLLDPRFPDFCRYARKKGMKILENTNGDALNKNLALCEALDGLIDILVIGLYDYQSEAEKNRQMDYWKKIFKQTRIRFSTPRENPKIRQNSKIYRETEKDENILTLSLF